MDSALASTRPIALEVEAICHAFVNAVDQRTLSIHDPVWRHMAPVFRADADFPGQNRELDLPGLLDTIQGIINADPGHHMRILTLNTEVDTSRRQASVYMTTEIHGVPAGVVRQNVAVFEFRERDGQWRGARYRGLRGMGGLQSGFGGF
ncbi:hypothetical protein CLAFUW4_06682 [Fulvia fulva]|uniref:SnoaL-like domain-containing protein n=1 Tax=Passalora fulva TaxID=5499 RepID=A0A9Q8PAI3_PASFU|nr:uncharacterized protein CLAFUR5_06825 [Fulvia fulva]KAK4622248.1 hypothetical protein CLAFUR4_06690 [Fulvia fulva]KAK4622389.1 hypothetical protein CLAFUR0_06684 [Fulvia fulva]UJO18914.1 hypothetical protein CLAFUR5_06825 [Fulvia fulva]WPV16315.1 hypothetical protein CLAFUW4_06682 [Fulvia fulva]WPV30905.1 hypothetical protein CLAFUW7_06681 [Fulvia fulva]